MIKFDFSKFTTVKYETNTHTVDEKFSNISIRSKTSDVVFLPSEDGLVKVVCDEDARLKHEVSVSGDALNIKLCDSRKWYDHIAITGFSSTKITVYLPAGEYASLSVDVITGDTSVPKDFSFENISLRASTGKVELSASAQGKVKITTGTGNISVSNMEAGSLELSVTTGAISASDISCDGDLSLKATTGRSELKNVKCKNLTSTGDTGKIYLSDVITEEKTYIKRDTGDVKFERCDAAELSIVTSTGDVSGSLLSDKIFFTSTDTGKIEVPKTTSGGVCEITTDTGDIRITIVNE